MKIVRLSRSLPLAVCTLAATALCAQAQPAARDGYHPTTAESSAIAKLIHDLEAIKAGSAVTAAEKEAVAADLKLLVTGTTKPSAASIEQFADDLATAVASGNISVTEKADLVLDIDAIFNSAGLSTAQAEKFIADVQAILVSSGITAADVKEIAGDLSAVVSDCQVNFLVTTTGFALTTPTPTSAAKDPLGHATLVSATNKSDTTTVILTVSTLGLVKGTYTVDATTTTDSTPVALGTIKVLGISSAGGIGAAVFGGSGKPFPDGFVAADLATVSIVSSTGTTDLSGAITDATRTSRLGNFRFEPGASYPDVLGNVAFRTVTNGADAEKSHFLLIGWKLPDSATLTLKVNGTSVGTVVTTDTGRLVITDGNVTGPVKADGRTPRVTPTPLPSGVDLSTLESLELLDASGKVVATAGFSS